MKKCVKTVLVTGGGKGIGAATVKRLALSGMVVYAASRSGNIPEGCESSKNVIPVTLDVNDEVALSAVVTRIVSEQGSLDAVVCSAGNGIAGSIEDTSLEEVNAQFETTFFGVVKTIQAVTPTFRKQHFGRVITVSSVAALAPLPFQAFYSCAKAGVLQLTKALSIEMCHFGVQSCCVMPGDVKTNFTNARKVAQKSQFPDSEYYNKTKAAVKHMEADEQKNGMSPDVIAKAIARQLHRRHMSPECVPGLHYRFLVHLIRLLPESFVLKILSWMY